MAAYDITQLDSFATASTGYILYNDLVALDDTHFVWAGLNSDNDGVVVTLSIDGSYEITELDYLVFEATTMSGRPSVAKIDSTHFAIAYDGVDVDGFIKTFSVDGSYQITELDSLEHDKSNGQNNSLALLDSTHLVLSYTGSSIDGFVSIFAIDGSYQITETSTLEFNTTEATNTSLVVIDSTHFAIAYRDAVSDGQLATFSVNGSYAITKINEYEFLTGTIQAISLTLIDSTHLAVYYYDSVGASGAIKTFSINGSYVISEIDELSVAAYNEPYISLIKLDATHLALAYSAVTTRYGVISIYGLDGSYNVSSVSSITQDSSVTLSHSLVRISDSKLILAYYSNATTDGIVKTFSVEQPVTGSSKFFQLF